MLVSYLQFQPVFGDVQKNIQRINELIKDKSFDLLVLPELSNSGYLFVSEDEVQKYSEVIPNGIFCRALKEISRYKNAYIVAGICEKASDGFYNSAVLVKPTGEVITYRKIQLFYEEKKWFKPGNKPLTVHEITGDRFGKVKIGMMVCFDWIFPEVARTLALKGAQIICHPANLVMPYCQDAMVTRALENHVFTITANRTGIEKNDGKEMIFTGLSEIVNPKGIVLNRSNDNIEECVVLEIDPDEALNKNINPHNNLFTDRREEFYFK